jgi:hypothetical protein
MTERSGVFLVQKDDSIISLQPGHFASEDDFQKLLARAPELLVGDQIDPTNPRRWILVRREQTISTNVPGASQWSIDHLFLDQDGVPTLVEVKRQTDTRIRREVVGQMLDYAANCGSYWSVEQLKSDFVRTCEAAKKSADEVLSSLVGSDQNADEFWQHVKTNLIAGRMRLLFVADQIPAELRRIVEFLNKQMDPAEVLAIELRQFVSDNGLKTLVPMVYGQTQEAARKKGIGQFPGWDRSSVEEAVAKKVKAREQDTARRIIEWMEKDGRSLRFGVGKTGSVAPDLRSVGVDTRPIYLSTDGRLYFQLYAWENRPVFGDLTKRRELMARLGRATGSSFSESDLSAAPSVTLSQITADSSRLDSLLNELSWLDSQLAASAANYGK